MSIWSCSLPAFSLLLPGALGETLLLVDPAVLVSMTFARLPSTPLRESMSAVHCHRWCKDTRLRSRSMSSASAAWGMAAFEDAGRSGLHARVPPDMDRRERLQRLSVRTRTQCSLNHVLATSLALRPVLEMELDRAEIDTAERGLSGGWDVERSGTIRACVLDFYNTDG